MSSIRTSLLVVAVLLLVAGPLSADPRWWWDDVAITSDGFDKAWPDACPGGGEGGQGGGQFIVWQQYEPSSSGGDWDVWITATGNQGCSFCAPARLTENGVDDTHPRVAVAVLATSPPTYGLQVVYESEGNAMLAFDAGTIPVFGSPSALCQGLAQAATNVRTNGQYRRMNATAGTARHPDIDLSTVPFQFTHIHVAWEDSQAGAWDIWTDRDLVGDTSGYGSPMNLTPGAFPAGDAGWPSVSGDSIGANPGDGGVSVAFVDSGTGDVLYLRSSDSGANWSATGAPPATPPVDPAVAITSSGPDPAWGPVMDSSDLGMGGGGNPAWEGAGWLRGAGSPDTEADLQHRTGGATADVPWNAGDYLCGTGGDLGSRAGFALQGNWTPPEAAWTFWSEDLGGGNEIVGRAGALDPLAATPVDFATFPYAPVRPLDTALSSERQISACVFDEGTWTCNPARTSGAAREPVACADAQGTYLVWIDTRSGSPELYYKRTDQRSSSTMPRLATDCETVTEARIDVEFDPIDGCASAFPWAEKIRRYLVYYGTDPRGPYLNAASPIVILPGGPTPFRTTIGGLALGTGYYVVAIAEDEAWNVDPADFDPVFDNPGVFNEATVTTPAGCAPVIAVGCSLSGEACPDPIHPLEGQFDFGETMLVTLTFRNTGTLAATSFTADFRLTHAVVNLPAGGAIAIPSVPAGGAVDVVANVTIDPEQAGVFDCGNLLDLGVANMQSDGGTYTWPDDPLPNCDYPVGGNDGTCTNCGLSPNVIVTGCALVAEDCAAAPRPPDGFVDPMEQVTLQVTFTNVGTQDASNFQADIALPWGGTDVSGFGAYGPVDITSGSSVTQDLVLDAGDFCGDPLDVDITNMRSNMAMYAYPDALTECDRLVGANPVPSQNSHYSSEFVTIPDDGSVVVNPLPVSPNEPRRVDAATLRVSGQMPAPATLVLRLEGPGGPPGLDVSAAWNAPAPGLDITAFYNGLLGGPGDYTLTMQDTQIGGGDGSEWQIQMAVTDTVADCHPCVACTPFVFGGDTRAVQAGECTIRVSWDAATGAGTLHYDLYRDGSLLQADLRTASYLDTVAWGSSHAYQVEAYDDCVPPGRGQNNVSSSVSPADPVGPYFLGPITADYVGAVNPDCTVTVDGAFLADCAPVTLVEILRDGIVDWSGPVSPLPYAATAPGNGTYIYSIRVTDAAGNITTADAPAVNVTNCDPPVICLHSAEAPDLAVYTLGKPAGWFLVPPGPGDQHVDDPTPTCPFAPGDRIAGVVGNGVALTFYDVNRGSTDLRVRSDAPSGNPDLILDFTP